MTRIDRFATLTSLLAVLISYAVTVRVFEEMAHIEDEMAYVWQAQAIAGGRLTLPSPPEPDSFLVPFVVDYEGQRFGKYPPGWPALLGVGEWLGIRSWINPLLAGLGVWLTYRLGKRTFGESVGLLGAGLTALSPFFLINSGSLLSHPFGLVLSGAFALSWLDAFVDNRSPGPRPGSIWLPTLLAALSLGLLVLTRPLTAVGVGLPFCIHALDLLARGSWAARRRLLVLGFVSVGIGSLLLLWQYAVTGDPLLNPYTLWWDYDKVGFGPGVGVTDSGHTLNIAWMNTKFSLKAGWNDLFGWPGYSWIFLPFGVVAVAWNAYTAARRPDAPAAQDLRDQLLRPALIGGVFLSLVLVYMAYWIGSHLFGPRYYYEALFSLTLFSAAGIAFLAGWPTQPGEPWHTYQGWRQARPLAVTALVALLVAANLLFYLPGRIGGMHSLYGIDRTRIEPFLSAEIQDLTPALVIFHPYHWTDYGAVLELETPFLDTPFIFVINRGAEANQAVAEAFPDRAVYHYYPDQTYTFYTGPRPIP